MEDQILQHEMTDILEKCQDLELGQNPINAAFHGKTKQKNTKQNKAKQHCL